MALHKDFPRSPHLEKKKQKGIPPSPTDIYAPFGRNLSFTGYLSI